MFGNVAARRYDRITRPTAVRAIVVDDEQQVRVVRRRPGRCTVKQAAINASQAGA